MASTILTVNVMNVPELIHGVMRQCAEALRAEADSESDPRIAKRLREIAAQFEAGQ